MISKRPYLLQAYYDWIIDSGMTPHLVVNAEHDDVVVPRQYIQDGKIILNVSPSAVKSFLMDFDHVSFNARFGGRPFQIYLPIAAINGIFARENGDGIVLTGLDDEAGLSVAASTEKAKRKSKPTLSAVDNNQTESQTESIAPSRNIETAETETVVPSSKSDTEDASDNVASFAKAAEKKGKPTLTVIK
ncbi:MAG: ClpXP protease specificity-enhancing factor [bacterium]